MKTVRSLPLIFDLITKNSWIKPFLRFESKINVNDFEFHSKFMMQISFCDWKKKSKRQWLKFLNDLIWWPKSSDSQQNAIFHFIFSFHFKSNDYVDMLCSKLHVYFFLWNFKEWQLFTHLFCFGFVFFQSITILLMILTVSP
jgi:hypothetical protein